MNQPIIKWSPLKFRLFMLGLVVSGGIGCGLGILGGEWLYKHFPPSVLIGWFQ